MESFKNIPLYTYFLCGAAKNIFVKIAPRNVVIEGKLRMVSAFDLTLNRLVNVEPNTQVNQTYVSLSVVEGVQEV